MSWTKLGVIALVIAVGLIYWMTHTIWAASFLGVLFAISLIGPASWLRTKVRMPHWVATSLVMLVVILIHAGLALLIGPSLTRQVREMRTKLPDATAKVVVWLDERAWGERLVDRADEWLKLRPDSVAESVLAPELDQMLLHGWDTVLEPPRIVARESSPQNSDDPGRDESTPDLPAPTAQRTSDQRTSDQRTSDQGTSDRASADGGSGEEDSDHAAAARKDSGSAAASEKRAGDESAGDAASGKRAPSEKSGDSSRVEVGSLIRSGAGVVNKLIETAALITITFVLTIFIAMDPRVHERGLIWLVPKTHEELARTTMKRLAVALRWWMLGRLISMIAIGGLTAVGMWAIGMPAPIALGAIAGILSFVPNIGPIVAAIPGVLLALIIGPWMVVWALCVYIVAQLIESYAVTPIVNQYAVATPPALVLVAQFVFAILGGIWGMIIATPALVVLMILIQQLYVREGLKKPVHVTGSD